MILNAGIPESRCLADQTKLIIMSESNKKGGVGNIIVSSLVLSLEMVTYNISPPEIIHLEPTN